MKMFLLFLTYFFFTNVHGQDVMNASEIINKAIDVHGGQKYKTAHFSFDFRQHNYEFHYDHGQYKYVRSLNQIQDVLTNDGFQRYDKGVAVELSHKKETAYANSTNSVHYFAFLPFFLNDAAVNKKLIGSTVVKGVPYYKVQVTFEQEGGGDDYDDIYVYWINKDSFTLDYLAYSFHVNGGGVRFREAYNRRVISGITFQDYVNYKDVKKGRPATMDKLLESGALEFLSKIELKNITEL